MAPPAASQAAPANGSFQRSDRAHPGAVTAVLGPTNTGKTHLAIERLVSHESGMIGLPLRLLAREVYQRVVERVGTDAVALITGEERQIPHDPRFWVCTVEAMPQDLSVAFVAIDEVQLAANLERGHVFTERILHMRGTQETLLLGASTMRPILEQLLPRLNVITRPRMSKLTYVGQKKITRQPERSAIVAFSANEVYEIAELIRRQRGGAAVVLGSLSPRTRNAQVELYQSGDVDFLVATDAVGMGLNLDVHHVAFAGQRKFDGFQFRDLTPSEWGQIAGRAGRHLRDGTFGVTGQVAPLDENLVKVLEAHEFKPIDIVQWRNSALDMSSIARLRATLDAVPQTVGLTRAPLAEDIQALDFLSRDEDVIRQVSTKDDVEQLWGVCQIPDYRKIAPANHGELVRRVFLFLRDGGRIPTDWMAEQVAYADRTDGDIDTLANRIAHIRTWTFVANRPDWLDDPGYWRETTRAVEDRLSDALHECLTQRFVDRRTSVLLRRLREKADMEAEITTDGEVKVADHLVGHLSGFRFTPDPTAEGPDAKTVRAAANQALARAIEARADRVARAEDKSFLLSSDCSIRWDGAVIGRLVAGSDVLSPRVILLADEQLSGPPRDAVQERLDRLISGYAQTLLKPLFDLKQAEDLTGLARGLAFQLVEALGVLDRTKVANDVKQIDQTTRAVMRKLGVRFGAYHIFVPALLKPAPSRLLVDFWALYNDKQGLAALDELPRLLSSGRTSIQHDPEISDDLYLLVGFKACGERAVRIDILERLADLIRPIIKWRPSSSSSDAGPETEAPYGAIPTGGGFRVTVAMMSLLGASGEGFASVLKSLGYRLDRKKVTVEELAAYPLLGPVQDKAVKKSDDVVADQEAPLPGAETEEAKEPSDASPEATAVIASTETDLASTATGGDEAETSGETGPATPQSVMAPDATAAASDDQAVETPQGEATPTPETGSEPAEEAAPQTEGVVAAERSDGDASDAPAETVEDLFVEIWRPASRGQRDRRRPGQRNDQNKGARQDGAGLQRENPAGQNDGGRQRPNQKRGGGAKRNWGEVAEKAAGHRGKPSKGAGKPQHAHRSAGPKKSNQEIDPDSPFAKLAALKSDLEQKKK